MSKSGQSLALYRELIPKWTMPGKRRKLTEDNIAHALVNNLDEVAIFDCRTLPLAFVDDTGDAVYEELKETGVHLHLPFPYCYFEFADTPRMIYALEADHYISYDMEAAVENSKHVQKSRVYWAGDTGRVVGHSIEMYDLLIDTREFGMSAGFDFPATDEFYSHVRAQPKEDFEFFYVSNGDDKTPEEHWLTVGKRVLAIATLLSEELVLDKVQPDPTPRVSRERKRVQKPPVSGDTHVLTINVPMVRYRAAANNRGDGTHEPPALHWRRGHHRVYHRGTNFEKVGWVQRCLVGDPAKGYTRLTQYRLVHRPTPFRVITGGKLTTP